MLGNSDEQYMICVVLKGHNGRKWTARVKQGNEKSGEH